MKKLRETEWWVILFVLGIVILNYPFIVIFNKTTPLFGYPLFFLYLYCGWIVSILIIFIYSHFQRKD